MQGDLLFLESHTLDAIYDFIFLESHSKIVRNEILFKEIHPQTANFQHFYSQTSSFSTFLIPNFFVEYFYGPFVIFGVEVYP